MGNGAWAFVRLARPHFLLGGLACHVLGVALARQQGVGFDLAAFLRVQSFVTCTQLMVHFANEAWDLEADRANPIRSPWSGGSRVLVEGKVSRAASLGLARILMAGALASAAWLGLADPRVAVLAMCGAILLLSWGYSAPPLRLSWRGLGPLTVAVVVTGLVPVLGFLAQQAAPSGLLAAALAPGMLAASAFILALDLVDLEGDAQAGKRTLAVVLGRPAALQGLAALALAGPAAAAASAWQWPALAGLAAGFPFALALAACCRQWAAQARWAVLQGVALLNVAATVAGGIVGLLLA